MGCYNASTYVKCQNWVKYTYMQITILAVLGLACFIGYDVWTVRRSRVHWPHVLFGIGVLCHAAATVLILVDSIGARSGSWLCPVVFWCAALLCLGLLVYTLFFALPFDDTYLDPTKKRTVCRSGMYALCRHPGVLWYILLYAALYLAVPTGVSLLGGLVLSGCNLAYVIVQDLWTFPRTFSDYRDYRQSVPFLIPTAKSFRRALQTRPGRRRQQ